jgi:uncharacterized membrane protein YphA (DoxX/SURF4 family)
VTAALLGVRFLFAAMFVYTGLSKVAGLTRFEMVLVQLFGTRPFRRVTSRAAAGVVAAYELLLAAGLAAGLPGSAILLALTMAVFAVVVFRAWRLHVDCGCFRDRRPSEVASLVRSGLLLGLAVWLAVAGLPRSGPLLAGLAWAVAFAAATYGVVLVVRRVVRRSYPEESPPRMVPALVADQILEAAHRPAVPAGMADADGWVEVTALCRATGLPVSTLFRELELRSRLAGAPLLATGTRLPPLSATSIRGERIEEMTGTHLVILFSATCTRCPKHVPEVAERLAAGPGRDRVLMLVAGTADNSALFTDTFDDLATVVLTDPDGPLLAAFSIREFPAFYVVSPDHTVEAAAHQITALAETPA